MAETATREEAEDERLRRIQRYVLEGRHVPDRDLIALMLHNQCAMLSMMVGGVRGEEISEWAVVQLLERHNLVSAVLNLLDAEERARAMTSYREWLQAELPKEAGASSRDPLD